MLFIQLLMQTPGDRWNFGSNYGDIRPRQALDEWRQKGVMGAAQHQRVSALFQQGLQIAIQQSAGVRAVQFAPFDAIGQTRAGLHQDSGVLAVPVEQGSKFVATNRVARGQNANDAAAGLRNSRF